MRRWLPAALLVAASALPAWATPTLGAAATLTPQANEGQLRARAAAGSTGFLVVWQAGVGAHARVRAARVGLDAKSVEPAGFDVASGDLGHLEPVVAAGHGEYLVGWTVLRQGRARVEVIVVGEDGVVHGPAVAVSDEAGDQRSLDLAATDEGFLATWSQFQAPVAGTTARVARLDPTGHPTGASLPLTAGQPWAWGEDWLHLTFHLAQAQQPRVLVQAPRAVVTWSGTASSPSDTNDHARYAIVDLASWSAGPVTLVSLESYPRVCTAVVAPTDGGLLFSWGDNEERGQAGPPSGNALLLAGDGGTTPVRFGVTSVRTVRAPALSSNGLVAFVGWVRKSNDTTAWYESPLVLRSALAADEPDLVVDTNAASPAFAVHASGATLLVWTRTGQATQNAQLVSALVTP